MSARVQLALAAGCLLLVGTLEMKKTKKFITKNLYELLKIMSVDNSLMFLINFHCIIL